MRARGCNAIPRRTFIRAAVGATAGLALGMRPHRRLSAGQVVVPPVPIPGGMPATPGTAGALFHVSGPGPQSPDAEPITITDFSGLVGLAYLSGTVTRTNTVTGETRQLPFVNNDMRFMKGSYRGTDGDIHQGAFAFI